MFAKILPMTPRRSSPNHGPPNRSVVAVAYDGLCAFEFGVATELFGLERPEVGVPWYEFSVVSVDQGPLRSAGGITINASTNLEPIRQAGTVVLPGWRNPTEAPPDRLIESLRTAHDQGARLLSICSGVFVLAATGLLDGKAATTHWRYIESLRSAYPAIEVRPDVLYVDNGTVMTSAGSAAGIDLGLHLIRRDYGPTVANQVARRLVLPAHRDGGQAQYIESPVPAPSDTALAPTLDWMIEHLDEPITVDDMANRALMTQRTFARKFRATTGDTPHRWLTRQRVQRAQELLQTTSLGVEAVARASGLGTATNLRHHFEAATHTTPSRYRATFGHQDRRGHRGEETRGR